MYASTIITQSQSEDVHNRFSGLYGGLVDKIYAKSSELYRFSTLFCTVCFFKSVLSSLLYILVFTDAATVIRSRAVALTFVFLSLSAGRDTIPFKQRPVGQNR